MERNVLYVDFYEAQERPMLLLASHDRAILRLLSETMKSLAMATVSSVAIEHLEHVKMMFDGELRLELLRPRRLADNVDIFAERRDRKLRIRWCASKDEWHDNADMVVRLSEATVRSCQYLSLPTCSVNASVEYLG